MIITAARVSNLTLVFIYLLSFLPGPREGRKIRQNLFFLLSLVFWAAFLLLPGEKKHYGMVFFFYALGKHMSRLRILKKTGRWPFFCAFCLILPLAPEWLPIRLWLSPGVILFLSFMLIRLSVHRSLSWKSFLFFLIGLDLTIALIIWGEYFPGLIFPGLGGSILLLLFTGYGLFIKRDLLVTEQPEELRNYPGKDLCFESRLVERGLLVTGILHELKNIFFQINAGLEYYRTGNAGEEALDVIKETSARGRELMERLLASPDGERSRRLCLYQEISRFIAPVRSNYRSRGIRVETAVPEDLFLTIAPGELEQILLNLVNNAAEILVKERSKDKRILITARKAEGNVVLEVLDQGPGVDEERQFTLFDPHISGKGSTGLGLFVVESLVKANKGTLLYLPRKQGSKFRVLFPPEEEYGDMES